VHLIARHYTREAGVRKLEQPDWDGLPQGCPQIAEGHTEKIVITPEIVHEFLGGIKVRVDTRLRSGPSGRALLLACVDSGGGDVCSLSDKMKGKGGFTITGQIGDVMKESNAGRH